ncbi:hypothetical protein F4802DRAFT_88585 [Xylaria palmicola]|nr:hypothetical protein F4802DRAFT_88585 [Xylaria palmicola]
MAEYLRSNVDPFSLGFLSVFLGGSIIHNAESAQTGRPDVDWDGLGIVPRKEDIISLLRERRGDLCDLLDVDRQDGSAASWEEALRLGASMDWQVLRFSGWTRSGSKRTLKIWSQEHLDAAAASPGTNYLGVLSHKTIHTIRFNHATLGPGILVCPPVRVTDRVYIMSDFDFVKIPTTTGQTSEGGVWPGIICDLLFTSRCVFESSRGLGAQQRRLVWSMFGRMRGRMSNPASAVDLAASPFLYRWASFDSSFNNSLASDEAEASRLLLSPSPLGPPSIPSYSNPTYQTFRPEENADLNGNSSVKFVSYVKTRWSPRWLLGEEAEHGPGDSGFAAVSDSQLVLADRRHVRSPFSRNSTCERASLELAGDGLPRDAFIKTSQNFSFELDGLVLLRRFYQKGDLQRVIAVDGAQKTIFYEHIDGRSLLEIRFEYLVGGSSFVDVRHHRWLIDIESKRAHDVMRSYELSSSAGNSSRVRGQEARIHQYFFHRLHRNNFLGEFYQGCTSILGTSDDGLPRSLDDFLGLPVYINDRRLETLQHHLLEAELLLRPDADHFLAMPSVCGLGDGHGGNLMVTGSPTTTPVLRYIDYEVAGYHPVVLDMVKPIYLDCFCSALWGDMLSDDLTRPPAETPARRTPMVKWTVDATGIHVWYELNTSFLDKTLARTKLEYLVCPVLEHLHGLGPLGRVAEQILAHALFCCALLTRDLSQRPDLFFLNLAVGLDLAVDFRRVMDGVFGPQNWPKIDPSSDAP